MILFRSLLLNNMEKVFYPPRLLTFKSLMYYDRQGSLGGYNEVLYY